MSNLPFTVVNQPIISETGLGSSTTEVFYPRIYLLI